MTCRNNWQQCEHLALVSKQLEEYTTALIQAGKTVEILDGCIPLIGYEKRPSTMLPLGTCTRNFIKERGNILRELRQKEQDETSPMESATILTQRRANESQNYFEILRSIQEEKEDKVFF